jgi:sugar-specific transcriptional regulator TrmB
MQNLSTILSEAGLDNVSSEIYLALVNTPKMNVTKLVATSGFSRTAVQQALKNLTGLNLISSYHAGRETFYQANHPNQLTQLVKDKKEKLLLMEENLDQTIKVLADAFNLNQSKPSVFFYEGAEALEKTFLKSLEAKDEIYSYLNREAFLLSNPNIMEKHIKDVIKAKVREKLILIDSENARKFKASLSKTSITQARLLPKNKHPFEAALDLFDGKLSYATFKKERGIVVEIYDPELCKMHRQLFEILWNLLPE